jgi:hypothetical protein
VRHGQRFPRLKHGTKALVKAAAGGVMSWLTYSALTGDSSGAGWMMPLEALSVGTIALATLEATRSTLNHVARMLPRAAPQIRPLGFLTLKTQLNKDKRADELRGVLVQVVNSANELQPAVAKLPNGSLAKERLGILRSMLGVDRKGRFTGKKIARCSSQVRDV